MNQQFIGERFRKNQYIWHYYDNNGVHIGIHIRNLLSDTSPRKSQPTPFHELGGKNEIRVTKLEEVVSFENKLFIRKGQKIYPLMQNLPSPKYNDDFGDKTINIRPNIIERVKLNAYAKLYMKFFSREGLSKEELSSVIELKQSLVNSRKKKIENVLNQKEYEEFVKSIDIGTKFEQWRNSAKQKNVAEKNKNQENEMQ